MKRKIAIFPDVTFVVLTLLGVFSISMEAWKTSTPPFLVKFIQAHGWWDAWEQLRWNYMYTHEVLHFLSGMFGAIVGCWMYFSYQKRKASPSNGPGDERRK
jgi:hypothetical protein